MTAALPMQFSDEQAEAYDAVAALMTGAGIDLVEGVTGPPGQSSPAVLAITGKAGSGKTVLLSQLAKDLKSAGVDTISGDWEGRRKKDRRTLAILAPTNKAASVLRLRGVPATTIHRILYTPVYDPEYEKLAAWLAGEDEEKPAIEGLTEIALERAVAAYAVHGSIPGALAAAGLRGSDFHHRLETAGGAAR
jgi:Uncharacterized conserved protein (DUF2075).